MILQKGLIKDKATQLSASEKFQYSISGLSPLALKGEYKTPSKN